MKLLLIMIMFTFTFNVQAGFEGLSNGSSLKIFNRIDCGAGLTCTRAAGGKFSIVSSGSGATLTDGNILVGNASNISTSVNPSGDVDITNAGVFSIVAGTVVEGDVTAQVEGLNIGRLAIFDYDFAVDGGAISTIATGVVLPAKAIIEKCWFRIETQLVDGGSGTLAVQCEDAGNILAAADQTGVAAGAFLASAITGVVANMVDDIAAACDISFVIAGAALTAGKLRGYCRYSVHP